MLKELKVDKEELLDLIILMKKLNLAWMRSSGRESYIRYLARGILKAGYVKSMIGEKSEEETKG